MSDNNPKTHDIDAAFAELIEAEKACAFAKIAYEESSAQNDITEEWLELSKEDKAERRDRLNATRKQWREADSRLQLATCTYDYHKTLLLNDRDRLSHEYNDMVRASNQALRELTNESLRLMRELVAELNERK